MRGGWQFYPRGLWSGGPLYWAGLVWRLLGDRRVSLPAKLVLPLAALYILSPFDLLPDLFLGLGQLDDLVLLLVALLIFLRLCPPWLVAEHAAVLRGRRSGAQGRKGEGAGVIEGSYHIVEKE